MSPRAPAPARAERPRSRLSAAERRGQILDAAEELFSDGPYEDVSLEQIAERAGITRGLINHHFGTRRELYIEVVRRRLEVPVLPIPEYVQGATVRERLDESIGRWLDEVARGRETGWRRSARPRSATPRSRRSSRPRASRAPCGPPR